jgi:signal transduction histidine kinase/ligand-binding sensor domain-containing protein/FixJ family two-component response regulator
MKISVGLFVFLLCSLSAFSQGPKEEKVTEFKDIFGLKITDIKQDKTGFLWVGTSEGLYRYDGYNFKLFEPSHKTLGSSYITTIFIDSVDNLWIGTRGGLLFYDEGESQFVNFVHDGSNPNTIGGDIINSIVEDLDHNIWIAFSKGGLDLLKKGGKTFHHFKQADGTGLLSDDISDLHVDVNNTLWISTWDFGMNRLDLNRYANDGFANVSFNSYPVAEEFGKKLVINFIFEDTATNKLYACTNGEGIFEYNPGLDNFVSLGLPLRGVSLYSAVLHSRDRILLSGQRGIAAVDLKNRVVDPVPDILHPVDYVIVNVIFIDKERTVWVGAENGLIKAGEKKMKHFKLDPIKDVDPINNVTALYSHGKYLWVAAWGGGLHLKDETTGEIVRVNESTECLIAVWDFKVINNNRNLLIATDRGLVCLDIRDMRLKNRFPEIVIRGGSFTSLSKKGDTATWVGTWDGSLYTLDHKTITLNKYAGYSTKGDFLQAVLIDRKNRLWFGTRWSGVVRLSNLERNVERQVYSQRVPRPHRITNDCVYALYEDKEGRIWIGTDGGGISVVDPETDSVAWILKGERNLPSNTVKAFIEDEQGNLWISFKAGLSRYDPTNGFINYTVEDGLKSFNFNINTATRGDSLLYFGSQNGYYSFRPSGLKITESDPTVFITDLEINNKAYVPSQLEEFGDLERSPVSELKSLTLNHKVSAISFEFSTLNFTDPNREVYAYKMENLSDEWTHVNASNRKVNFSNLTPGEYVFRVKVIRKNADRNDEGRAIYIHIIPPFWQTLWFKLTSFLAFIGLLYVSHRIRLERLNKQKIKFEKLADERIKVIEKKNIEIQNQTVKLHEADKSKLDFFTNLSHEFRTPLMLIIGPLRVLLEKNGSGSEHEKLTMIQRNAQRLLRLMDQIMDITKLDAGTLKVDLAEGDVVKFIGEIAHSFQYLADTKQIQFDYRTSVNEFVCYFDHDKVEKILYNLLSNAFKVTPQYGSVSIVVNIQDEGIRECKMHIEISNTGIGIPKEELGNLFTRFHRTNSYSDGTGIGLSLTKSLIDLQGGSIEVKSEEHTGTTFYVRLPVQRTIIKTEGTEPFAKNVNNDSSSAYLAPNSEARAVKISPDPQAKTVLIVDDDEDMRKFMSDLLHPTYTVVSNANGEEGIKSAFQYQPDLIISDMMMPVIDGYQLMRTIKKDSNVSHIPVILLTGKDSVEARLQGLEEGADDYITKPFNEKILLARVKNLIEQRRKMKERFSTDLNLKPKELTTTSVDEKFMQNLLDIVETNIADPEFNAEMICQGLGVGRSYLYSKIKALTDLSVNEFVKTMRLKKAAVLLQTTDKNVNEVAYTVGFSDRSHFSKSFTKHFGVTPAQYQKEA